ncbi:MAG: MFS transporter [Bacillota bacterium]|nr:MFS transporter [Bacillota bacterium]
MSLNFKKFLLLWSGELISSIGGGLTSFGLGVYVFAKTGSAASMALVSLLAFLPTLVLSIPAGVLADRYDRRLLMMIGDGLSGLGILYILLCMIFKEASVLDICFGVLISSVFSSLLEPSYRATITDLLSEEEYSQASGMVSLAGSARYLVSPLLAGLLLSITDIKVLLIIDICTFILTVISTSVVKRGMVSKKGVETESLSASFKEGWMAICEKKGMLPLLFVASLITTFMGFMQILSEPMILDFASSSVLGITETICASGMLVSSVYLGMKGLKNHFVKTLSFSLVLVGMSMILFGFKENLILIGLSGFAFFLCLPFANNSLDYLVRTNIEASKQGRAWGFIGFITQIGYVVAYGCSGLIADSIANLANIGVGRASGMVIMVAGLLLAVISWFVGYIPSIRALEKRA